ncbi:MAG: DUF6516 family protein [candidate division KSB1 bacterium]|nr:DUF6516 family protein [candidate division KSB1 bacterium]MDZ7400261.1 DUF6516 family protein [candidate division KSB1 bacterium]
MNPIIVAHFDSIEDWLLLSSVVADYKIIRREIAPSDGKIRLKVTFVDGSLAELFEYVIVTESGLNLSKYSFHWQDMEGKLKCRWDNAPHHPELPNAPHHKHNADQTVIGISKVLDLLDILKEIEKTLPSKKDPSKL